MVSNGVYHLRLFFSITMNSDCLIPVFFIPVWINIGTSNERTVKVTRPVIKEGGGKSINWVQTSPPAEREWDRGRWAAAGRSVWMAAASSLVKLDASSRQWLGRRPIQRRTFGCPRRISASIRAAGSYDDELVKTAVSLPRSLSSL